MSIKQYIYANANKKIVSCLRKIKGINTFLATDILNSLGLSSRLKCSLITDQQINLLDKEIHTRKIVIDKDLYLHISENINIKVKANSYKGYRHMSSLPVRGNRTRSNGKTAKKLLKVRLY